MQHFLDDCLTVDGPATVPPIDHGAQRPLGRPQSGPGSKPAQAFCALPQPLHMTYMVNHSLVKGDTCCRG